MNNGNGDPLTPEEQDLIEAVENLSIEEQLFAGATKGDVHIGPITFSKGESPTAVTLEVTDDNGRLLLLQGTARQVIRRDDAEYPLGIVVDLTAPEEFMGRVGEAWFQGDVPQTGGFFAIRPEEEK